MILDTLAAAAKARVARLEKQNSLVTVRAEAEQVFRRETCYYKYIDSDGSEDGRNKTETNADKALGRTGPLEDAVCAEKMSAKGTKRFQANLQRPGLNFICECKKASPSKGLISPEFPYLEIAKSYERGGAAAISVLTEPEYFLGSDVYLREIAAQVSLPVLRKDFTVSQYQIYEAKVLGADAILLICAILPASQLEEYRLTAESVGLDALVETHDGWEIETALKSGAKIVGINNRNLQDFTVDIGTCLQLRKEVPEDRVCIAESGIGNEDDVHCLKMKQFNGVLIGETLMRNSDPEQALRKLRRVKQNG